MTCTIFHVFWSHVITLCEEQTEKVVTYWQSPELFNMNRMFLLTNLSDQFCETYKASKKRRLIHKRALQLPSWSRKWKIYLFIKISNDLKVGLSQTKLVSGELENSMSMYGQPDLTGKHNYVTRWRFCMNSLWIVILFLRLLEIIKHERSAPNHNQT